MLLFHDLSPMVQPSNRHQVGTYKQISGRDILQRGAQTQQRLDAAPRTKDWKTTGFNTGKSAGKPQLSWKNWKICWKNLSSTGLNMVEPTLFHAVSACCAGQGAWFPPASKCPAGRTARSFQTTSSARSVTMDFLGIHSSHGSPALGVLIVSSLW